MSLTTRVHNSALLIFFSLFPSLRRQRIWKSRAKTFERSCPAGYIPVLPEDFHEYINYIGCHCNLKNTISVFVPDVYPLTAPFLLGHLKKSGFSGCRVKVSDGGLAVTAVR